MRKFKLIAVFTIIAISIAKFTGPVYSSAPTAKSPCRIEVSIAHISKDILAKTGRRAVKVDAFSKCNVTQSKVTLTVELWKVGEIGNHFLTLRVKRSSGITMPGRHVENFATFVFCKDRILTNYFGVAYSKAFIAGKWQFAHHVLSRKIIPIHCGT
jgi:hypothetical protein